MEISNLCRQSSSYYCMERVVAVFAGAACEWKLSRVDDVLVMNSSARFATQDRRTQLVVRAVSLFEETIVLYITHASKTRPIHINVAEYQQQSSSTGGQVQINADKLKSFFNRTIFAPLLQPDKEYPGLTQLSHSSTFHVLGYLQVCRSCTKDTAFRLINVYLLRVPVLYFFPGVRPLPHCAGM